MPCAQRREGIWCLLTARGASDAATFTPPAHRYTRHRGGVHASTTPVMQGLGWFPSCSPFHLDVAEEIRAYILAAGHPAGYTWRLAASGCGGNSLGCRTSQSALHFGGRPTARSPKPHGRSPSGRGFLSVEPLRVRGWSPTAARPTRSPNSAKVRGRREPARG